MDSSHFSLVYSQNSLLDFTKKLPESLFEAFLQFQDREVGRIITQNREV